MKLFRLCRQQTITVSIEEAWDYFSNPRNLAELTPRWLGFDILTEDSDDISQMYAGMIIQYKVSPLPYIRMCWASQITDVQKPYFFADLQISGPYKYWYHEHMFKSSPDGTEVRDTVYYAIPLGPLGGIIRRLLIKKRLNAIFDYRAEKMTELF